MTQEEQIKQVAEYAGVYFYSQMDYYLKMRVCAEFHSAEIKPPKTTDPRFIEDLEYHTSLDWLNPVWVKVYAEALVIALPFARPLQNSFPDLSRRYHNAIDTGNISAALTAVSDAISWLKEQKKPIETL